MGLKLRTPANLLDFATLFGVRSAFHWSVARAMFRASQSFAFLKNGEPFAVAGFFPLEEGGFEAWFLFAPEAARHMGFIVRQTKLTLASGDYDGVVTICTSQAGARLAALCGFSFQVLTPLGEAWAYGHIDGGRGAKKPCRAKTKPLARRAGATTGAN